MATRSKLKEALRRKERRRRRQRQRDNERRTEKWIAAIYEALPADWTICWWSRGVKPARSVLHTTTVGETFPDTKRVYMPTPTTPRAFWVCAHELGHVRLHFDRGLRASYRDLILSWRHRSKSTWQRFPRPTYEGEYEAERFAENFLRQHGAPITDGAVERGEYYVRACIAEHVMNNGKGVSAAIAHWCHLVARGED
jgi:hypothetical protein